MGHDTNGTSNPGLILEILCIAAESCRAKKKKKGIEKAFMCGCGGDAGPWSGWCRRAAFAQNGALPGHVFFCRG